VEDLGQSTPDPRTRRRIFRVITLTLLFGAY